VLAACQQHQLAVQERVELPHTQWDSCQFRIRWWNEWQQHAHYPLSSRISYTVFSNLDLM